MLAFSRNQTPCKHQECMEPRYRGSDQLLGPTEATDEGTWTHMSVSRTKSGPEMTRSAQIRRRQ
eukprot:5728891-Alexandrium_andersonii.AAC.1